MKNAVIVLLVLLVGAAAVFVWQGGDDGNNQPNQNQPEGNSAVNPEPTNANEPAAEPAATINYTDDGFEPTEVSVTAGSTVLIRNNSSIELQFSSDEHPTHTDNSELNAETIAPGQSTTIVAETAGTWGFHNHAMDGHTGTLIVE